MVVWQRRRNVSSESARCWVTLCHTQLRLRGSPATQRQQQVSDRLWYSHYTRTKYSTLGTRRPLFFTLISRWQVPIHKINFQFLTMLFVVNSRCESWVIHVNCYWIVTYEQYNYPIWGFMCGFSGYQALTYNEVQTRVCSLNRSEFNQDFSHEDEKNIYQQLYL